MPHQFAAFGLGCNSQMHCLLLLAWHSHHGAPASHNVSRCIYLIKLLMSVLAICHSALLCLWARNAEDFAQRQSLTPRLPAHYKFESDYWRPSFVVSSMPDSNCSQLVITEKLKVETGAAEAARQCMLLPAAKGAGVAGVLGCRGCRGARVVHMVPLTGVAGGTRHCTCFSLEQAAAITCTSELQGECRYRLLKTILVTVHREGV